LGDDVVGQAESNFTAGEYHQSRELALKGLASEPDNVRLLRVAGRSSVELDLEDGVVYLQKLVELTPDDQDAWRDLASASINSGDAATAVRALREVIRRAPEETSTRYDLAHLLYASGQPHEAIGLLLSIVETDGTNLPAWRSLVDMYREQGDLEAALRAAHQILQLVPDSVLAKLDSAQLNLALANYSAAALDYAQLRTFDPDPDHLAYAYYGLIHVEVQRSNWRRALDHAIDATRVDRGELTTQLLAFIATRLFGDTGRETLTQAEVEAVLTAQDLEYRRQLVEGWTAQ
jgi:tetratricopeptide (TPR) repeat protein